MRLCIITDESVKERGERGGRKEGERRRKEGKGEEEGGREAKEDGERRGRRE